MQLSPMTVEAAAEICTWRYAAPYDVFNWPEWEEMKASGYEFGDAGIRQTQYAAIHNHAGELIGFGQFFPMVGTTRLGLGLRPDLCDAGLGAAFVHFLAEAAVRLQPENEVDLEVLTWNTRAIKAYTKAGFIHTDTYERNTRDGVKEFRCMVYVNQK